MADKKFEGKNVLIAGGGKNLGGLLSRSYAEQGANVAIHYNSESSKADAEKTLSDVESYGVKGVLLTGDLTDPGAIEKLFADAKSALGQINIAVNTAGKMLRKPITETTEEDFDSMFSINTKTAYFFMKEAGKNLADNGDIVNISTSLLAAFTDGYSVYAGGKASVEHFTRAAAKEFMPQGISVNSVAPGPMDTPFLHAQETDERLGHLKSQAMKGRLTEIDDIAPLILFLSSDEGHWVTGQTIFANGGFATR